MNAVLIIGCGDIGRRLASLCRPAPVTGVVRSPESGARLTTGNITPRVLDLDAPFGAEALPAFGSQLYYLAPPPPHGDSDPRVAAVSGVLRGQNRPQKLVYLSTTAVYGDCGGRWIDETARLVPGTARGRRRLDAERRWLRWGEEQDVPVVVLRVPGIYGPGRLPIERLKQGLPVLAERESPFTNRIHADDLARVCLAAMQQGRAGEAYNVADGHPTTMTDYFNQIADRLGLPRPPVVDRQTAEQVLSPSMLSFLSESKRLLNRKMLDELGVRLRYPDLDHGLAALLETGA
ncbi:MAG: SDR family oxidoreductase [Gammaproteobacteria bacterium]|jgi:nucleoside-diphosphate-sugar epimerase